MYLFFKFQLRRIKSGVTGPTNGFKGELKLEKIMTSWANRYRFGSYKNKAPSVPENDQELGDMVRICQILYELYVKLTTFKGIYSYLALPVSVLVWRIGVLIFFLDYYFIRFYWKPYLQGIHGSMYEAKGLLFLNPY